MVFRNEFITHGDRGFLYTAIMTSRFRLLVISLILLLASCAPNNAHQEGAPEQLPVPSPTPASGPGTPQLIILAPFQIDSANGRIYTVAQVNGELKIAVLKTGDGSLISAWDGPGQLAVDSSRDRLVVDRGAQGLSMLDALAGIEQGTISLPAQDGPAAPQINRRTGLIYAFRESTLYVIDPAIRGVVRTIPLQVGRTVCDTPSGDAPIYQSAINPDGDRLYLSFISHTCIPWFTVTVVAFDTASYRELGRDEFDINTQFVAYDNTLFGTSVTRLGPTLYWAWDGVTRWHEESGDFEGQPAGMAIDHERGLIFEAVGESIRVIDPDERAIVSRTTVPLLQGSRLAGYDRTTDTLYFTTPTGRLFLLSATNLSSEASAPVAAPSPLPASSVRAIVPAPNWADNGTVATIIDEAGCSNGGRPFIMVNPTTGWSPVTTGSDSDCPSASAIAFSPAYRHDSLIFMATNQPPTVWRSLDTGRSWTAATTDFPEGTTFTHLLVSPGYSNDQTLFALTSTGLLYRSRDGAISWQLLDQRLDQVAVAKSHGPAPHLYGVTGGRLLRSGDGGGRWEEIGPTPDGESLVVLETAPSENEAPVIYVFTAGGRLARSLDGGLTWLTVIETSPGPAQLAIARDMVETQRPVFLLQDGSITASYDGMESVWAATSADEAGRFHPTTIAVSPNFAGKPFLFAGTSDGQIIRVRADPQP